MGSNQNGSYRVPAVRDHERFGFLILGSGQLDRGRGGSLIATSYRWPADLDKEETLAGLLALNLETLGVSR